MTLGFFSSTFKNSRPFSLGILMSKNIRSTGSCWRNSTALTGFRKEAKTSMVSESLQYLFRISMALGSSPISMVFILVIVFVCLVRPYSLRHLYERLVHAFVDK